MPDMTIKVATTVVPSGQAHFELALAPAPIEDREQEPIVEPSLQDVVVPLGTSAVAPGLSAPIPR